MLVNIFERLLEKIRWNIIIFNIFLGHPVMLKPFPFGKYWNRMQQNGERKCYVDNRNIINFLQGLSTECLKKKKKNYPRQNTKISSSFCWENSLTLIVKILQRRKLVSIYYSKSSSVLVPRVLKFKNTKTRPMSTI